MFIAMMERNFQAFVLLASEKYRKNPRRIRFLFISLFLFLCTDHIKLPQSVPFSIIERVIYFNLTLKTNEQKEFLVYPLAIVIVFPPVDI